MFNEEGRTCISDKQIDGRTNPRTDRWKNGFTPVVWREGNVPCNRMESICNMTRGGICNEIYSVPEGNPECKAPGIF